ncbi:MAG: hypothetical protein AB7E80_06265 [Hyphomicrobiaceae bacterium]
MLRTILTAMAMLSLCGAVEAGTLTKYAPIHRHAAVDATKYGDLDNGRPAVSANDNGIAVNSEPTVAPVARASRATPPLPVRPAVEVADVASASADGSSIKSCRRFVPAAGMTISVRCTP